MKLFKNAAAPFIVVAGLIAYLIWLFFIINGEATMSTGWKIISFLILAGLIVGGITVLYQRLKEIKKEDEDDVTRKY